MCQQHCKSRVLRSSPTPTYNKAWSGTPLFFPICASVIGARGYPGQGGPNSGRHRGRNGGVIPVDMPESSSPLNTGSGRKLHRGCIACVRRSNDSDAPAEKTPKLSANIKEHMDQKHHQLPAPGRRNLLYGDDTIVEFGVNMALQRSHIEHGREGISNTISLV